jgi:outer membrane protein assembly factor BamB
LIDPVNSDDECCRQRGESARFAMASDGGRSSRVDIDVDGGTRDWKTDGGRGVMRMVGRQVFGGETGWVWRWLCLVGLVLGRPAGGAELAEWSQFRGPQNSGRSGVEDFPLQWTEQTILWKVETGGAGDSSVSVWGDACFYLTSNGDGTIRRVVSRRISDGGLAWEYSLDFDTHPKHAKNSYATATVATGPEGVYATFGSPTRMVLLALELEGKKRWLADLGPFVSQHGPGASPILVGKNVVLPIEQDGPSRVVALDRQTGETSWSSDRSGKLAAYATPLFVPDDQGGQVVVSSIAGVSGLDATTGQVLWEENCFADRCVSSPILLELGGERLVLAGSGKGGKGNRVVAIDVARSSTVKEARLRWDLTKTIPYCPTPLVLGGTVYFALDSGIARAVRATDGEEIWTERACDKVTASPIELGGAVLMVSETGECVFLADQGTFEVKGRYQLDDEFLATPAVGQGRLFLRGQKFLWCIGRPQ